MPRGVVAVGGVDPSGAAGVAAIASTARLLGAYSTLVPTCNVVEDSGGVRSVYPVGGRVLREMLEAALGEVSGVVALSLHPRVEEARATREVLESAGELVLLDPVWRASAGQALVLEEPRRVLQELLRVTDILVANLDELGWLAGYRAASWSIGRAVEAARLLIRRHGLLAVIAKGGHGLDCVDLLVERDGYAAIGEPGCLPEGAHGTGCVYLGALSAALALGLNVDTAALHAWRVTRCAVEAAPPGRGARLAWPGACHAYWAGLVKSDVERALRVLLDNWGLVEPHAPETGINIVSAAPPGVELWAGVSGRVRRGVGGRPEHGPVELMASSHLYRLIRAVNAHGATWVLGAVNIRMSEDALRAARRAGLLVALYDRRLEPPEVKAREGATIPWGVSQAMRASEPLVPDAIGHWGDWGKEPMLVFTGPTALEAVEKMVKVLEAL